MPHELTENQKILFEVPSSLILCHNNELFLNQIVTCDEKWILYNNWQWPGQWSDQEEAPNLSPKANLHPKRSWSLFGGLFPIWSTTAFWILGKPLHLKGMLNKSMKWTENCNDYSWCSSTEWANSSPQWHLTADHTINASKIEHIGLQNFALSTIFTWPLTKQIPLLQVSWQYFSGKMLPQPAGGIKCFLRVHWILKHGFLHYKNKQTYWQKCVDCNGSYLDK